MSCRGLAYAELMGAGLVPPGLQGDIVPYDWRMMDSVFPFDRHRILPPHSHEEQPILAHPLQVANIHGIEIYPPNLSLPKDGQRAAW